MTTPSKPLSARRLSISRTIATAALTALFATLIAGCRNDASVSVNVKGLAPNESVGIVFTEGSSVGHQTAMKDGDYAFSAYTDKRNGYASVRIETQPKGQRCAVVDNPDQVIDSSYFGSVQVSCGYVVTVTTSDLDAGQSVRLTLNDSFGYDYTSNGTTAMPAPDVDPPDDFTQRQGVPVPLVPYAGDYSIVMSGPSASRCVLTNGSATEVKGPINVSVVCNADTTYTIGGSVSGLASGTQVTLQNNAGDPITVSADGAYAFAMPVLRNGSYNVTVSAQPTAQTCSVANQVGSGVVANVGNADVTCSATTFSVAGAISGLASGQSVTLRNNGTDALVLNGNTSFAFATRVPYNGSYAVTVATQPTGQTCSVAGASGSGVTAAIANVAVTCATNAFSVGGNLSGLSSGLQVTLRNNGADPVTLTAVGAYGFAQTVPYNGSYAVTVATQPLGQTCSVAHASGSGVTANIGNADVICAINTYTVSGTVSGLSGGQVTLRNNGADPVTIGVNGAFAFATPVPYAGSYSVTIGTQPTGQTCSVASFSGSNVTANVGNVSVTCATNTYTIGGTLTGLTGGQVTLENNGADPITLGANGSFNFPVPVPYGGSFSVAVSTQPTGGQTCTVTGGSASAVQASVANVSVSCATSYTIGGAVSGLGFGQQVMLLNNGGDATTVSWPNSTFTFGTGLAPGDSYAVTVASQTAGLVCTPSNASGSNLAGSVNNVAIACAPGATVTIGGTVNGLGSGEQVVLLNNGADPTTVVGTGTGSDSFTFNPIASGTDYMVSVSFPSQPLPKFCVATTNASGFSVTSSVNNVSVDCN